jgi:hypothetical protein
MHEFYSIGRTILNERSTQIQHLPLDFGSTVEDSLSWLKRDAVEDFIGLQGPIRACHPFQYSHSHAPKRFRILGVFYPV